MDVSVYCTWRTYFSSDYTPLPTVHLVLMSLCTEYIWKIPLQKEMHSVIVQNDHLNGLLLGHEFFFDSVKPI